MAKTIINNPYQSPTRQNWLKIAGFKNINDTITPKNGERIYGQVGAVYFNQLAQNDGNDTGTITPPDCPDCPQIDPPTNPDTQTPDTPQGCTCRSLDELGDYIEQKASESFCESTPVEDDNQYFPCLTGADGDELRISCPITMDCDYVTRKRWAAISVHVQNASEHIKNDLIVLPNSFLSDRECRSEFYLNTSPQSAYKIAKREWAEAAAVLWNNAVNYVLGQGVEYKGLYVLDKLGNLIDEQGASFTVTADYISSFINLHLCVYGGKNLIKGIVPGNNYLTLYIDPSDVGWFICYKCFDYRDSIYDCDLI